MKRTRRTRNAKNYIVSSSEDEDSNEQDKSVSSVKTRSPKPNTGSDNSNNSNENIKNSFKRSRIESDSSSESDIEAYLKRPEELNLNSSFFKPQEQKNDFSNIEKNIFAGVNQLSDSESESDDNVPLDEVKKIEEEKPRLNFEQLTAFTKKIEEAKIHVAKYNAKKKAEEGRVDINNLLAVGEKNLFESPGGSTQLNDNSYTRKSLKSSDFETLSDSEKEDWEEVEENEIIQKSDIPKEGVEITVQMPDVVRKKKGVDLLAAMKRRLNKIRKENQVYVHQVHLLCWIAHGNYINDTLNNESLLAMALSLLPSQNSYPTGRTDLKYLEQIVKWYNKSIKVVNERNPKDINLQESLMLQINRKTANTYKTLVYIFVCILRALGIQCRLVLSLQVEPLRPPASELNSLSTKDTKKKNKESVKKTAKTSGNESNKDSEKIGKATGKDSEKKPIKKTEKAAKKKKPESKIGNEKKKEIVKNIKKSSLKNKEESENKKQSNTKQSLRTTRSTTQKELANKNVLKEDNMEENTSKENNSKDETKLAKQKPKAGTSKKSSTGIKKVEVASKISQEIDDIVANLEHLDKGESVKKPALKKISAKKSKMKKEVPDIIVNKAEPTCSKIVELDEFMDRDTWRRSKSLSPKQSQEEEIEVPLGTSQENITKPVRAARKTRSKPNLLKIKLPFKKKKVDGNVPQIDGNCSSSDESDYLPACIPQPDGADDSSGSSSPQKKELRNLKHLTSNDSRKRRFRIDVSKKERRSEDDFQPQKNLNSSKISPASKRNSVRKVNETSPTNKVSPKKSSTSDTDSDRSRFFENKKPMDVRKDIVALVKDRIREQKSIDGKKMVKHKAMTNDSDSDSDYVPETIKKKQNEGDDFVSKVKVKRRIPGRKELNRDVFACDNAKKNKDLEKNEVNVWVEVFLEDEEKWISADVVKGRVHCIKDIYNEATHPVTYVLSWDNSNKVKDISKRYCPNWNTVTRKLRCDPKWWEQSLKPFIGVKNARDREEDEDLARQQLDEPLPKTISEYKDHPLYVLPRHLLKFQAIYPPDAVTLGFVRNEPVYSRDCVYVLHSREIWLKHAKVVKPGEKPYKIVKARPKYDRLSNTVVSDLPLEIYGEWQVSDYVPPTAENGTVPRNAYGNVELFKPCMLPKKTVHLQLPGLNKVAKKLNIDCAPAVTGFDFHSGWSHPTFDGFVVCEEFGDTLVKAWFEEQQEAEKREKEKYEKRVFGNWKKLIKGLLIRERLKARYDFGAVASTSSKKPEKKKKK